MSSTLPLYQYEVVCATDGAVNPNTFPSVPPCWGTVAPTLCPVNPAHTVITTRVIGSAYQHQTTIKQEDVPAGQGYMEFNGFSYDIPSGNTGDVTQYLLPITYNMNIYLITIVGEEENLGDYVSSFVSLPSPVGYFTQAVTPGDTSVNLSNTALGIFQQGFSIVTGYTSAGGNIISRVSTIDTNTGIVTLQTPSAFSAAQYTPVYLWIHRATDIPLTHNVYGLGKGKIGGSYAQAGLTIVIRYKNNSGQAKKFRGIIEDSY